MPSPSPIRDCCLPPLHPSHPQKSNCLDGTAAFIAKATVMRHIRIVLRDRHSRIVGRRLVIFESATLADARVGESSAVRDARIVQRRIRMSPCRRHRFCLYVLRFIPHPPPRHYPTVAPMPDGSWKFYYAECRAYIVPTAQAATWCSSMDTRSMFICGESFRVV